MSALVLGIDTGLATFGWVVVDLLAVPTAPPGEMFADRVSEHVVDFGLITTAKSPKKSVRKCDDLLRRIVELADAITDVTNRHGELALICAEAISWPQAPMMDTTTFLERDVSRDRFAAVGREIVARFEAGDMTVQELRRRLYELEPAPTSLHNVENDLARHAGRTRGLLGASTKIALSWGVVGTLSCLLGLDVVQVTPQMMRSRLYGERGGSKSRIEAALVERYGPMLDPIIAMPKTKREHVIDALAAVTASLDHKLVSRVRAEAAVDDRDIDFG